MDLAVAEEKKPKETKESKPGFTTFRVYDDDGEDMSDLAGLDGKTAADVYREHCAPVIRKLLREKIEQRLKRLK